MSLLKIAGHMLRRRRTWGLGVNLAQRRGNHQRMLASFDFDHTILAGDCYETIEALLEAKQHREELHELRAQYGWMAYIERLLCMLQQEQGLRPDEIVASVRKLRPMPGMPELLRRLAGRPETDMCIISDANSYFIEQCLDANDLTDIFDATSIFTNSASLADDGKLEVAPFEQQSHCDRCPANLCKGSVMEALMQCGQPGYSRVLYCGDGCNDLCPMLQLREQDFACIRHGEQLHDSLSFHRSEIRAQVFVWRDGVELQQKLQNAGCF
ncbi:hypothetical protein KR044_002661, partial [Drosophila immigrans]